MLIFVRPESFPTQKNTKNGFKSHDVYYSLSWKDRRTPRFLLDVVGSHEHNSRKCMNCWFVLTFQQSSVWSQDDCHMSKGFYSTKSTHKKKQGAQQFQLLVSSKKSSFSSFQNPTGWTIRSPWSLPTFSQEPHMHWALLWEIRRPQMWSEQINGSSLDWKTRSVLSWKNQFCFGTYILINAKQIFKLNMNLYQCIYIYICTSKQLVSSLCVDRSLFLNAFVLEWFLNGVQCRCWSFWRFKMDQAFDISIEMTQKC